MKILITGSNGFIGKNLLHSIDLLKHQVLVHNSGDNIDSLKKSCLEADIIFHLAGVNRPSNNDEFYIGNSDLTKTITSILAQSNKCTPIVFSSSIQTSLNNDYGKSKSIAEKHLIDYHKKTSANIYIFKLANVFGKWSRPNYNSVVATWCHNVSRNLDIHINNSDSLITLVYIDDVIRAFLNIISGSLEIEKNFYYEISPTFTLTLGELKNIINGFKESRNNLEVFDTSNLLIKYLYSTYLSYMPKYDFEYKLDPKIDARGSFTEILKSNTFGQVSVNVCKPNIKKGEHWHHTKVEKFIVVSGQGIIRFRSILESEIIEYEVNGRNLSVVDIPPGYTHNIENTGDTDLITLMWVNEGFNPEMPDTIYEVV